jgi:predicted transposase YbfD/YdcC
VPDPRDPRRVAHPLPEVLLLVVCGTICDCDDYDAIAEWGEVHLPTLRRFLPYHFGVPCGRWLTILMNRLPPALFAQAFTDFVREAFPGSAEHIAIDGKTSRRSHDRATGQSALHLVSAFATARRLVLGQEVVPAKANELAAIPTLIEKLAANEGLKGAMISIDAIATNADIAQTILDAGADYLLAVKANQSTIRAEIERYFDDAPAKSLDRHDDVDKGHGRIEERFVTVSVETDWLDASRRFPGETRLPKARSIIRVVSRTQLADRSRFETRFFITSRPLSARDAATAVRATGPSRTPYTGPSTSSSTTTCHASGRAMAPPTWPSSVTSPSTSCAKAWAKFPSNACESAPAGTPRPCSIFSNRHDVNLDSEPCRGQGFESPQLHQGFSVNL